MYMLAVLFTVFKQICVKVIMFGKSIRWPWFICKTFFIDITGVHNFIVIKLVLNVI